MRSPAGSVLPGLRTVNATGRSGRVCINPRGLEARGIHPRNRDRKT